MRAGALGSWQLMAGLNHQPTAEPGRQWSTPPSPRTPQTLRKHHGREREPERTNSISAFRPSQPVHSIKSPRLWETRQRTCHIPSNTYYQFPLLGAARMLSAIPLFSRVQVWGLPPLHPPAKPRRGTGLMPRFAGRILPICQRGPDPSISGALAFSPFRSPGQQAEKARQTGRLDRS